MIFHYTLSGAQSLIMWHSKKQEKKNKSIVNNMINKFRLRNELDVWIELLHKDLYSNLKYKQTGNFSRDIATIKYS